jgi:phosphoribosylaminoimidazole-succinocarboxamide synthase
VVASDRVSAYDHILPTPIPDKGRILTAMSLWWFDRLAEAVSVDSRPLAHHVISTDVPQEVAGRAMICRRLRMLPVECVARGYLAGSGLAEYQADSSVCGIRLPPGLAEGSRLDEPLFTPATKAALGDHDENVSFERVVELVGEGRARQLRTATLDIYRAAEVIARQRGLILADTKFEFGVDGDQLVLADEVLTPDSSRYWAAETWSAGQRQPSFDKQIVRDWLTSESGWNRVGPPPSLPDDVVSRTRDRYLQAYRRLTGREWT